MQSAECAPCHWKATQLRESIRTMNQMPIICPASAGTVSTLRSPTMLASEQHPTIINCCLSKTLQSKILKLISIGKFDTVLYRVSLRPSMRWTQAQTHIHTHTHIHTRTHTHTMRMFKSSARAWASLSLSLSLALYFWNLPVAEGGPFLPHPLSRTAF